MAERLAFYVDDDGLVREKIVKFKWEPGFCISQKQKCVDNLHNAIATPSLEVSTKSRSEFGKSLSAFNLKLDGYYLESVYQASKYFENGGPFFEMLSMTPKEAKKHSKEIEAGKFMGFSYRGVDWTAGALIKSAFYDYLYYNALYQSITEPERSRILEYECFTDIEFNHKKSFNTQARACAFVKAMLLKFSWMPNLECPSIFNYFHNRLVKEDF